VNELVENFLAEPEPEADRANVVTLVQDRRGWLTFRNRAGN
jgi:hypothetical protein